MATAHHTPASSVSSISSPVMSTWSRGHSSKSSASSTSSPTVPRESLDLYATQKRLEDVREEEDVVGSRKVSSFDDYRLNGLYADFSREQPVSPSHPSFPEYSLADQDSWSTASSHNHHDAKRQRSLNGPRRSMTQGLASRFGSLSRRWRNRSDAQIGPPLSIITHVSTTPVASPRASLDTSANYYSRSTSLGSPSQDPYSPTSMHSFVDALVPESEVVPIYIDQQPHHQETTDTEQDQGQPTTPLLPPTMLNLRRHDSLIQSPLQSPSIAPTTYGQSTRLSIDKAPFGYLPSPPLSTRPSLASMPRSRANTATHDIPTLQQLGERLDPWGSKLGHADFTIHPEPYLPEEANLDSYKEFRENWTQARKQYAQHLARTIENYGETSKVYKLTEAKWSSIDEVWKGYNDQLSLTLTPQLARLSDGPATPDSPISLLEKPVTRVVVPQLDKTGKFPEIGDSDIVGPLSIGAAKVPELQRGPQSPPTSPKRRNFLKSFSEKIFTRH